MPGLTKGDVFFVVNRYIGVNGGYLGDFTYRTHEQFYPEYCDLDIDPNELEGTTRERFIKILSEADPFAQARILQGVLEKFPPHSSDLRTPEAADRIRNLIGKCRSSPLVPSPNIAAAGEALTKALADAELLLSERGATSALDRVHTVLHGYLKELCRSGNIDLDEHDPVTTLFKRLRKQHPALGDLGPQGEAVNKVLRSLANVIDALNPARNHGSLAHPNDGLVGDDEAMLFINAARTVLQYLQGRVTRYSKPTSRPVKTPKELDTHRGHAETKR